VIQWIPRPEREVFDACGPLWDSPIEAERIELTVDEVRELPLVDEDDNEINIYTSRGTRVARRLAVHDADVQPYAGLVKLRHIHELFVDLSMDDDDDEDNREPTSKLKYYVYPQAGLQQHGHFQAEGLINKFKPFLKELNAKIRTPHRADSLFGDEDDEDEQDHQDSRHLPVTGIATQGYNSVMHFARGKGAQHHDAQLGHITAALAGSYAQTPKEIRIAKIKITSCRYNLPHERFASKIEEDDVNRELRLENVYYVDLLAMKPEYRTGG
jgi:hypothetical protein